MAWSMQRLLSLGIGEGPKGKGFSFSPILPKGAMAIRLQKLKHLNLISGQREGNTFHEAGSQYLLNE